MQGNSSVLMKVFEDSLLPNRCCYGALFDCFVFHLFVFFEKKILINLDHYLFKTLNDYKNYCNQTEMIEVMIMLKMLFFEGHSLNVFFSPELRFIFP